MAEWGDPAATLLREFGAAMRDIRAKLIEEGWFGQREQPEAMRDIPDQRDEDWLNWMTEGEGHASGEVNLAREWTGPTVHGAALPPRQSFEEAWAPRKADQEPGPPGIEIDR